MDEQPNYRTTSGEADKSGSRVDGFDVTLLFSGRQTSAVVQGLNSRGKASPVPFDVVMVPLATSPYPSASEVRRLADT